MALTRWAGKAQGLRAVWVLSAAALVLPATAVFAPLGVAPLLAAAAFGILAAKRAHGFALTRGLAPLPLLLAALSFWAVLSAIWSILPAHSLIEGLRFGAISLGGMLVFGAAADLTAAERARIGTAATMGVLIAALLLLFERATDGALTHLVAGSTRIAPGDFLVRFDRGATTLALAFWPALTAAGAARRKFRLAALLVCVPAAILSLLSTTGAIAILASLATGALARSASRLVAALLAGGVVLLAAGLPMAAPDARVVVAIHQHAPWFKASALHRLMIWHFTGERIAERPVLGWGMDASRGLPGGDINLHDLVPDAGLPVNAVALPLHPHNAALQWRVELGLPGTALALAIVLVPLLQIGFAAQLTRDERAAALGWACAALIIAMLSYGIWQAWWLSCLWLTATLEAAVSGGDEATLPARA